MLLDERENKILEFMVRDFIKTAQPVSSVRIREGLKLQESPATVRNIVADLDENGFFNQPHTSAGRIPTDKAYRYFVDNLISEINLNRQTLSEMRKMMSFKKDAGRFFAEALNLLCFSNINGDHFDSFGLLNLFKEPEFQKSDSMQNAGYLIDHINEIADLYRNQAEKTLEIFIGKENPVGCAKEFGMFYLKSGQTGRAEIILLFGPKRMNYERILNYTNCFMNEF
jgi:transcriptional regulator of heat shock response